ncbi:Ran-specific GTPase-activating protein 30 [Hypoxylon texense]
MLVNVGDMQYILDPAKPMQIGPDFTLSIYMPFRAHVSSGDLGEPYGVEEGQRKPIWQEVLHKTRVRLRRIPFDGNLTGADSSARINSHVKYAYQLQIVEDLDDGRVHTCEEGDARPSSYDGVPLAGIRESIPVHQISKMFYADVGRILNINNDDGGSSNPVLLLKRDVRAVPPFTKESTVAGHEDQPQLLQNAEESIISDSTLSQGNSQDEINFQILQECKAAAESMETAESPQPTATTSNSWRLPRDLDPEWIALEVFEMDDDNESHTTDEDQQPTPGEEDEEEEKEHGNEDQPSTAVPQRLKRLSRPSVDSNLATQLNRMSIASSSSISRPPSSGGSGGALIHDPDPGTGTFDEDLLERSPFGAIHTSLSLLEMLLRLTSLQEFEQATHLSIPDHVLRFYLDESASRVDA